MNNNARVISALLSIVLCVLPGRPAGAATGIGNTKHNLSKSGPGAVTSTTEDRICVFCHTPHNASPATPLWNKDIEGVNYAAYPLYTSTTMVSQPSLAGPTGSSRLCLSCHDGTSALGVVLLPKTEIPMTGTPMSSRSNFGTSLASHHPISFSYSDAQSIPNPELAPEPPANKLIFYANDIIQCNTCHDPHDNTNKKFLAESNENSGLCILCHTMYDWETSSHRNSPKSWNHSGINPWPRTGDSPPYNPLFDFGWTRVDQNACENCHAPHQAGGAQRLLNYATEEDNCFPCHNGNVASKNIQFQFGYASPPRSRHNVGLYTGVHDPKEALPVYTKHVECVDCHNPHASNSITPATAPYRSGILAKVSGVDQNGQSIEPPNFAEYEYEICYKCHADSSPLTSMINRVISTTNAREQFDTANPSYHPVVGQGKNSTVPSLPSSDLEVPVSLGVSSSIYCTDCHSDEVDSGNILMSRGPHGSPFPPILRREYEMTMNTTETLSTYGLCYRCHDRTSIRSDASFRQNSSGYGGHLGHLTSTGPLATQVKAPCSVCHDPHGIKDDYVSGSHTYLINFDTNYVQKYGSNTYPFFTDNGGHHGSCTLVCHDAAGNAVNHDGSATFSY